MNNKEYKNKLMQHDIFSGSDYLYQDEIKDLYSDIKSRIKLDNQIVLKEFNNRASIKKISDNEYELISYYTTVCSYKNGSFKKLWYGYSATTLKHINLFLKFLGIEKQFNKHDWIQLDYNKPIKL